MVRQKFDGDLVDEIMAEWHAEMPELDTTGLAVAGRVFALSKLLETRIDRMLKEFGCPLWGFDVLTALRRAGDPYTLTPTRLMRVCLLTSGAMTHRLDRMEKLGFLTRSHDTKDRRSIAITLTLKGKELVDRALPARIALVAETMSDLSVSGKAELATLLRTWAIALEGLEGS